MLNGKNTRTALVKAHPSDAPLAIGHECNRERDVIAHDLYDSLIGKGPTVVELEREIRRAPMIPESLLWIMDYPMVAEVRHTMRLTPVHTRHIERHVLEPAPVTWPGPFPRFRRSPLTWLKEAWMKTATDGWMVPYEH